MSILNDLELLGSLGFPLGNIQIIESTALVVRHHEKLSRSWRERLFTRPWRPWQSFRTVIRSEPDPKLYRLGGVIVGHPATVEALRIKVREQNAQKAKDNSSEHLLQSPEHKQPPAPG